MEKPSQQSINTHFKREAYIPALIFGAILGVAALAAIVGPWLYQHL